MMRVERQRRVDAGLRLGQPSPLRQGHGQVVVGVRVLVPQREGAPQRGLRFVQPVGAHQEHAQVAERLGIVGVEPGRHRHGIQGPLRVAAPVVDATQQFPAECVLGEALDQRTRGALRILAASLGEQGGGGVDLDAVGCARAGQLPFDVVDRRALQAVGPAELEQLHGGGELARLDQGVEIGQPMDLLARVGFQGGGEMRDRGLGIPGAAGQQAHGMVGAGVAGLEVKYRPVQGERLLEIARLGFVVCGLHGLVDDLADVVAGGERAHGATLGYVAGGGQGGATGWAG